MSQQAVKAAAVGMSADDVDTFDPAAETVKEEEHASADSPYNAPNATTQSIEKQNADGWAKQIYLYLVQ